MTERSGDIGDTFLHNKVYQARPTWLSNDCDYATGEEARQDDAIDDTFVSGGCEVSFALIDFYD